MNDRQMLAMLSAIQAAAGVICEFVRPEDWNVERQKIWDEFEDTMSELRDRFR